MTDHIDETKAFNYANRRIKDLLNTFNAKGVCGCCTGRALMYNAARLCEETMGSTETVSMLKEISDVTRKRKVPRPDYEGEGKVIDDDSPTEH